MTDPKPDSKRAQILVIDDNNTVLSRAKAFLKSSGYDVVATNQTVGLARYTKTCEIVIVDYHMPGLDGGDVLKSLQEATAGNAARPMFYLYTSDDELTFVARRLGFDGAFTDKGNDQRLVEQVNAAMRLRRLRSRARG